MTNGIKAVVIYNDVSRNFEDPWEAAEFALGGDQLGIYVQGWMGAPWRRHSFSMPARHAAGRAGPESTISGGVVPGMPLDVFRIGSSSWPNGQCSGEFAQLWPRRFSRRT